MSDLVPTVPDFLIWHCVGCGAPAEGKKKPCDCVTNVGGRTGPNGRHEHTWWVDPEDPEITRLRARITELEAERDTATRALADLDRLAWLAAEEDSWFGDETDITVQRAAAERHRAALAKTEGKG